MEATGIFEDDLLSRMELIVKILGRTKLQSLTLINFFFQIVLVIICSLTLFTNFDANLWQQYSPAAFGALTAFISYLTFVLNKNNYLLMLNILCELKSYARVKIQYRDILENQAKIAEIWMTITICSGFGATISCQPFYGDEYNIFLPVKLIIDSFGKFANFGLFLFFAHLIFAILVVIADGTSLIYLTLHLKFQLFLLNRQLEEMKLENYPELVDNEEVQEEIYENLTLAVQHHQVIIKLSNILNDVIFYPIIGYTISSIATFVAIVVLVGGNKSYINPLGYVRIPFLLFFIMMMTGGLIFSGQCLQVESEELFQTITNLPWYYYNAKNKKLVVMLMLKTKIPLRLSSFGLVTINYQLLIKLFRSTYSCITFLMHVQ